MGYDIDIVKVQKSGDTYYRGPKVGHTGLSYNWSDLHRYWYVRDDMHGMKGSEVMQRLEDAFKKFDADGIEVAVPDPTNENWGWGTLPRSENNTQLPERIGVFYYHLKEFYDLAKQYPHHYFIVDACDDDTIKVDGEWIPLESNEYDSDDFSDDQSEVSMEIHVRHPIKGTDVLIKTKEDALEMFGLTRQTNKQGAKQWLSIAEKLPSEFF